MKRRVLSKCLVLAITLFMLCAFFASCDKLTEQMQDEWQLQIPEGKTVFSENKKIDFQVVLTAELTEAERASANAFVTRLRTLGFEINEPISDADAGLVRANEIIIGTGVMNRAGYEVSRSDLGTAGYYVKVVTGAASSDISVKPCKIILAGGSDAMTDYAIKLMLNEILALSDDMTVYANKNLFIATAYEKINLAPDNNGDVGGDNGADTGDNGADTGDNGGDNTDTPAGPTRPTPPENCKFDDITACGVSLSNYVFEYSTTNYEVVRVVDALQELIFNTSGIYVPKQSELMAGENPTHKIKVRVSGGNGDFKVEARTNTKTLDISCGRATRIEKGYYKFVEDVFNSAYAKTLSLDTKYTWDIAYRYSEFGAVGDGVTDDFNAIRKTHEKANVEGLSVVCDEAKTYYIGATSYGQAIPVKTAVDFGNAKFIIDDRNVNPFDEDIRERNIFEILPSDKCKPYFFTYGDFIDKLGLIAAESVKDSADDTYTLYKRADGNPVFKAGQTNLGLSFDTKVMLLLKNHDSTDNVYIRYGSNANKGSNRSEIIIVDRYGNVDPTTPILWDYSRISLIQVFPVEETQITIKGGTFTTYANQLKYTDIPEGYYSGDQYYYFGRGIYIARSNTVVSNVNHKVEKEATYADGAARDGGYPYRGFMDTSYCNNVVVDSCRLSGHMTYKEDRVDTTTGKPKQDSGSNMGSYDINSLYANNLTWRNCTQYNSITNSLYWGIMGTNFVKNITYDGCTLSRFDSHQGAYNASVINSTIGSAINVVGAGELKIIGSTKLAGDGFISLRDDYGSIWNGKVTIKDCRLEGYTSSPNYEVTQNNRNSSAGIFTLKWNEHNFGYTCYMPQEIEIDNFTYHTDIKNMTLFRDRGTLSSASFTSTVNPYIPPKSITIKNQTQSFKLTQTNNVFSTVVNGKPIIDTVTIVDEDKKLTIN